jgi:DHA1 family multidrug resistance protein-like MFS transporter
MNIKTCLIALTLVSVVCDTMLLPFYPQFFKEEFGLNSSEHVGFYIATCCFSVMMVFPLWAKVAKYINELHLWVYTQIAAAILGICCYLATDIVTFWVLSQLMLMFKASYLLIYPFVMRLEEKDKHLGMVGLFAVLMHFGGIGGALLGGFALEVMSARDVYLIMAGGDTLQVFICLWLIRRQKVHWRPKPIEQHKSTAPLAMWQGYIAKLGLVSLLLYFSAFLIRPFFSLYWHQVWSNDNELVAALVYSIPAWAAIGCLWYHHRFGQSDNHTPIILSAFFVAVFGLMMQGSEQVLTLLIGRGLFGIAMFQATVRVEVMLFKFSKPEHYGSDFSKIHIFQNLGVIGASFAAGSIVDEVSLTSPFYLGAAGFALAAFAFYVLFSFSNRFQSDLLRSN